MIWLLALAAGAAYVIYTANAAKGPPSTLVTLPSPYVAYFDDSALTRPVGQPVLVGIFKPEGGRLTKYFDAPSRIVWSSGNGQIAFEWPGGPLPIPVGAPVFALVEPD